VCEQNDLPIGKFGDEQIGNIAPMFSVQAGDDVIEYERPIVAALLGKAEKHTQTQTVTVSL